MLDRKIHQLRKLKHNVDYFLDDTKRLLLQPFSSSGYINQKEIKVVGLRRSGNHGIIIWLRRHYQQKIWHLNNVSPFKNPYRQLYHHYSDKERLKQEALGNFSPKECLIYNYENYTLESIVNSKCEKNHDLYLGKSANRYDLLILRDPYNMFASLRKGQLQTNNKNYCKTYPKNRESITQLWLNYAKEFLEETNYLQQKRVMVNYNQWVSNLDYRKSISQELDLNFCDAGFNVVKNYGGGSSFDGTKFNAKADKMDVLNRWQEFVNDEEYRKMFNKEIIEYSQKIFGYIEGTEALKI